MVGWDQVLSEFAVRPKVNSNVPPPPPVHTSRFAITWAFGHGRTLIFKEIHTYIWLRHDRLPCSRANATNLVICLFWLPTEGEKPKHQLGSNSKDDWWINEWNSCWSTTPITRSVLDTHTNKLVIRMNCDVKSKLSDTFNFTQLI